MGFKIGSGYEENRNRLALKIRDGALKGLEIRDYRGLACYFCLASIDGKARSLSEQDSNSKDVFYIHSNCYYAAKKGEMDTRRF